MEIIVLESMVMHCYLLHAVVKNEQGEEKEPVPRELLRFDY